MMQVYQIKPRPKPRGWRAHMGFCAIDEQGKTWFNPQMLGPFYVIAALTSNEGCLVGTGKNKDFLMPVSWAMKEFPSLAGDLEMLDQRIREFVASYPQTTFPST